MRLGAFLQYSEYTVSRHQRAGRSTCHVHPSNTSPSTSGRR